LIIDRVLFEKLAVYPGSKDAIRAPFISKPLSRPENFLIDTGGFKIRKQRSIDTVVFRIVGGLFQIIMLLEVFKIKLGNAVLKCGKRGAPPVTESVTQKHKITDYTVGNQNSIQLKFFNYLQCILPSFPGQNYIAVRRIKP